MSFLPRLRSLINKVAKLPERHSYLWDENISLLAWLSFHIVTVLRLLSPLQWFKVVFRIVFGRDRLFQKRTNFHAKYTELYFIVVIALLLVMRHLPATPGSCAFHLIHVLSLYLAAESVVWTAYYLFFRHFIEKSFTIYHHAEYFLAFPLALTVQVLGLSTYLSTASPLDLLALIFNLSFADPKVVVVAPAWEAGLALLGLFYVVVLLANLRDAFPKTQIKPITSVAIIGAGDVVSERLLPALTQPLPGKPGPRVPRISPAEINRKAISVYDYAPDDESRPDTISYTEIPSTPRPAGEVPFSHQLPVKVERHPQEIVVEIAAAQVPVIIATPPDSHFFYLGLLQTQGIRFAVEKPISVFEPEIRALLSPVGDELFADGFAMSYYALEKALPLNYLYRLNPFHRQYLNILIQRDGKSEICHALPWNQLMDQMGSPTCITVMLLEGIARSPNPANSTRQWTEDPHLGGLFFETTIHAITVLQKVIDNLNTLDRPEIDARVYANAVNPEGCTFSRISGSLTGDLEVAGSRSTRVDLIVGKYIPESLCARGAIIEYPAMTVLCNFDDMSLKLQPTISGPMPPNSIAKVEIAVRSPYREIKYGVQTSLIRTFFEFGWRGLRYDDYSDQKRVLEWLLRHRDELNRAQQSMPIYKDESGLPGDLQTIVDDYKRQWH